MIRHEQYRDDLFPKPQAISFSDRVNGFLQANNPSLQLQVFLLSHIDYAIARGVKPSQIVYAGDNPFSFWQDDEHEDIAEARKVMREAFEDDPEFRDACIRTVASVLYDVLDVSFNRSGIADRIVKELFSK